MMTPAAALAGAEPDLIVRREGGVGVVRLNRPKTINAMTLEMSLGIDAALDRFEVDPAVALVLLEGAGERGLCAGGDIRGLYESSRANGDLGKVFWRQEYIMNARIAKFPKPLYSKRFAGIKMIKSQIIETNLARLTYSSRVVKCHSRRIGIQSHGWQINRTTC